MTRNLPANSELSVVPLSEERRSGDLVIAEVRALGIHDHLEDPCGRRIRLYPGDCIAGALGNRYATDFFEGYVPHGRQADLLTAGGLIGTVATSHDSQSAPTTLEIMGALASAGAYPLSLDDFVPPPLPACVPALGTIVVVGSGMNAGKTTAVVSIIRGLNRAGLKVGAGKVTGSGSGKDRWAYLDAGVAAVADFLDFGMSSTFGYPLERIAQTMLSIRDALARDGAEIVVLEIADGILQGETAWLLSRLKGVADAVVFAASDALSARGGVEILRANCLPVRAISGVVTRSPLACREIALDVPVLTAAELANGSAMSLLPTRMAMR